MLLLLLLWLMLCYNYIVMCSLTFILLFGKLICVMSVFYGVLSSLVEIGACDSKNEINLYKQINKLQ